MPAAPAPPLEVPASFWVGFVVVVLALLAVDLLVFHRRPHEVRTREAVGWTVLWISLALAFNAWIWFEYGGRAGSEFLTAYVVEESLSIDNLFVFLVLFQYFKVPAELQHRVLFFGILGAIVMRAAFIVAGLELLAAAHWVNYVFGAFLVLTALKLLVQREERDPEKNVVLRVFRRLLRCVPEFDGTKLTVVRDGRRFATMLLLVVVVVEGTDVVFAVDSVPAVLGVTQDKFIAYTSNICAILGLRAMYFVLARFMAEFRYLKPGLALVLAFIGLKMCKVFELSSGWSLAVIGTILAAATAASALLPAKERE